MSLPNILLIEDNPSDIHVLRRALDRLNEAVELHVLPDGEAALGFIQNQRDNPHEARPCVIVLDLHLPKYDGLEVLRAIRKEPILNHVRVMVVTGSARPELAEEIRAMGVAYRQKPSRLSEFDELAAELIALCKGLQLEFAHR